MVLYEEIVSGNEKVSIVGLGYVGLPIAIAFAKKVKVLGFDISETKVNKYREGFDVTNEVGDEAVKNTTVEFTYNASRLIESKFHIVAVPTPVSDDHTPDLRPVESASRTVGQNLSQGSIVVFESSISTTWNNILTNVN